MGTSKEPVNISPVDLSTRTTVFFSEIFSGFVNS